MKRHNEAGEGLGRIAALARDDIGGDHQHAGKQQAGDDAGGEQVGNGNIAAA
ncbi:hypothetical protein D3C72_2301890 [compost metagenome]